MIRRPRPNRGPKAAAAPATDLSYGLSFFSIVARAPRKGGLLFHRTMNCATVAAWPAPPPGRAPSASEQLGTLLGKPWPVPGRPPKHDLSTWRVVNDWPNPVPVTLAEVEVFERWFGDLFDELFSSPL
ncbi:hypothetical protein [Sphingopyxis chilensis]